jgi:replicative DNA helicase
MATDPSLRGGQQSRRKSGNEPGRGWPEKNGGPNGGGSFTASSQDIHRTLPHSIEAEQGVLGSMLISPREIIAECVEKINEEYFYVPAHQTIYVVLVELWNAGQGIDLITFTQVLRDRNLLETVGGAAAVTSLFTFVPTAANVTYYLEIVREKYILRQIIAACTESVRRSFEEQDEVHNLLDEVEQKIFSVGEDRFKGQVLTMKDQVMEAIEAIEHLYERRGGITGISTGFAELDRMTNGLHESEMIVIAARPSMGKCLTSDSEITLADGSIATIEEIVRGQRARLLTLGADWRFRFIEPSAFVDDGIKPVYHVVTRLGRSIETTLAHPFLSFSGWTKLEDLKPGMQIAVPRALRVFGEESCRDCEIKLLAYLIGDGCLTDTTPEFTNGNPRLRADFAEAAREFGDLSVREDTSANTRTPSLHVAKDRTSLTRQRQEFGRRLRLIVKSHSRSADAIARAAGVLPSSLSQWASGRVAPGAKALERLCTALGVSVTELLPNGLAAISRNARNPLTLWLARLGLWEKGAHAKHVPPFVFRLKREAIALFLNRLFATDGWATLLASGQIQLGYSSVSARLIRQIQHLLLRFGVIVSIRHRQVKYGSGQRSAWQLDITDADSIKTFAANIGIFGKEDAVERCRAAAARKRPHTNRDLIPPQVWAHLAKAKGSRSWAAVARSAGFAAFSNIHVGRRALSRRRLAALAAAVEDGALEQLATSDVYWDTIVSIMPAGEKQVYDLTIRDTHNFVANDICVHNTALAMNIAEHVAINEKLPVAVFSLEMSSQQLVQRLLCSRARVNLQKVRDGFLAERDFPSLTAAASKLAEAQIFIDDSASLSILELRAKARRLKAQKDIKLIVVDYLQLLRSTTRRAQDNRQLEISEISSGLKGLAKELKVPVLVLAQLNRQPEARTGGKPRLSDLRESGSIEQDADLVGLLVRPEIYEEDEDARAEKAGEAELIIAKQRNGPVGEVSLTFLKEFTRFEDRARNVPEPM